jgi:hypothetical protein
VGRLLDALRTGLEGLLDPHQEPGILTGRQLQVALRGRPQLQVSEGEPAVEWPVRGRP